MEDDIEPLLRITNIEEFKLFIKDEVWKRFKIKIYDRFFIKEENVKSILNKKEIDEKLLPDEILNEEVNKFIIIDEYDTNKGFILKIDITRLILSLTNEIISKHLNTMVDDGIMEMCWDMNKCEFIWRPNIKE